MNTLSSVLELALHRHHHHHELNLMPEVQDQSPGVVGVNRGHCSRSGLWVLQLVYLRPSAALKEMQPFCLNVNSGPEM